MADNKFMSNVWKGVEKALPYLDATNDLEQLGNLYGVSEEDRNASRLKRDITGERRPLSHTATEVGAWMGANVVPEVAMAMVKGGKTASKAAKAVKKFNNGNEVVTNVLKMDTDDILDPRIVSEIEKAGNKVSRDGVNAAKTASKGKAVRNTAKGAWAKNSKDTEKLLDDVKDGITLRKVLDNAPSEKEWGIGPGRINESIKDLAIKDGAKAGIAAEAINKALAETHTLNDLKAPTVQAINRKPLVAQDPMWRYFKQGMNMQQNFLDIGTDPDKYNMKDVNYLVSQINKDGYFDQNEIDDLSDVEKIWFLRKVAKGKYNQRYNGKYYDKAYELTKIFEDLTNNSEDKK